MSKVRTFSKYFPKGHPKAGQQTHFVEKIWKSLYVNGECPTELNPYINNYFELNVNDEFLGYNAIAPKKHTIRAGRHFKAGDVFSPRAWSGKPYASKQTIIAPDITIQNVFDFEIEVDKDYICVLVNNRAFYEQNKNFVTQAEALETLAKNDGLTLQDFKDWFKWGQPFWGQIICWNKNVSYPD